MSLPPLTLNAWLRYDLIQSTLRDLDGVERILEIGTGLGALAVRLAGRYDYVGVELDPVSYATAHERLARLGRGTVVCGDFSALEPDATFDLACAFEVLEHIEDDAAALREWRRRIRPGGSLLFSVPAHEQRWGAADQMAGHFRRYERKSLEALLADCGYRDVRVRAYGFPLGYVLEPARNRLARRVKAKESVAEATAASGRFYQPPDSLGWATRLATAPFRLAQRPFVDSDRGTGFVVVALRDGD